jgi:hypothetical protein
MRRALHILTVPPLPTMFSSLPTSFSFNTTGAAAPAASAAPAAAAPAPAPAAAVPAAPAPAAAAPALDAVTVANARKTAARILQEIKHNEAELIRLNSAILACDTSASSTLDERITTRRELFTFLVSSYKSVKMSHAETLQILVNRAHDSWLELSTLLTRDLPVTTSILVASTFETIESLFVLHAITGMRTTPSLS